MGVAFDGFKPLSSVCLKEHVDSSVSVREGGREREGREREGREGRGREGEREGEREGGREGGRERERERERERDRHVEKGGFMVVVS